MIDDTAFATFRSVWEQLTATGQPFAWSENDYLVDEDETLTYCQAHLWFRDEPLPRNASGKFLERALQHELAPHA